MIGYQIELFFLAVAFLTRLPVPKDPEFSEAKFHRCARYFPLVGLLVGTLIGALTWALSWIFPASVAVLLGMAASLRLTGAFHEDGLADSADGLGGAFEPARILDIMKDSRLGTYGACTLCLALLLKWQCLSAIFEQDPTRGFLLVAAAHTLSRLAPLWLMITLAYRGDLGRSKSKPLTQNMQLLDLGLAHLCAIPALFLVDAATVWVGIAIATCLVIWWRRLLQRKLHGYTGDTLGAAQQLVELALYLVALRF